MALILLCYLVSGCQQIIRHLVQIGSLVCVNEAHHLFENLRLHVVDLHTVLMETDKERGVEIAVFHGDFSLFCLSKIPGCYLTRRHAC